MVDRRGTPIDASGMVPDSPSGLVADLEAWVIENRDELGVSVVASIAAGFAASRFIGGGSGGA